MPGHSVRTSLRSNSHIVSCLLHSHPLSPQSRWNVPRQNQHPITTDIHHRSTQFINRILNIFLRIYHALCNSWVFVKVSEELDCVIAMDTTEPKCFCQVVERCYCAFQILPCLPYADLTLRLRVWVTSRVNGTKSVVGDGVAWKMHCLW